MITDPDFLSYLVRISLALCVLSLCAFFILRMRGRSGVRGDAAVKLLASLPLGRDAFFVVRCGPDVLAFTSGTSGTCLMGRWKYEEWVCAVPGERRPQEDERE